MSKKTKDEKFYIPKEVMNCEMSIDQFTKLTEDNRNLIAENKELRGRLENTEEALKIVWHQFSDDDSALNGIFMYLYNHGIRKPNPEIVEMRKAVETAYVAEIGGQINYPGRIFYANGTVVAINKQEKTKEEIAQMEKQNEEAMRRWGIPKPEPKETKTNIKKSKPNKSKPKKSKPKKSKSNKKK